MSNSTSLASHLTVISPSSESPVEVPVESVAEKVRRLQAEARSLAREQVNHLEQKLEEAVALAHEIAEGGDAYPVGAREIARRLVEDTPKTVQTLEVILSRV
jgi:preprotein translocase subunit SecA